MTEQCLTETSVPWETHVNGLHWMTLCKSPSMYTPFYMLLLQPLYTAPVIISLTMVRQWLKKIQTHMKPPRTASSSHFYVDVHRPDMLRCRCVQSMRCVVNLFYTADTLCCRCIMFSRYLAGRLVTMCVLLPVARRWVILKFITATEACKLSPYRRTPMCRLAYTHLLLCN